MGETVNDRILSIVNELFNGNLSSFARAVNVKQPTLNTIVGERKSKPSFDVIASIINAPALNISAEWLLTGEGSMLKPDTAPDVQLSDRSANYQGTFTEPINTILGGSGNTIGASARERIAKKKAEKGIGTQPEAIQLMHEIQILNVENEKLKAEIEHLKENLRLKDTVIQAKDEVIKLLADKK